MGTKIPTKERKIVLSKPLSLNKDSDGDYKASDLLQGILSLLKDVRPGSDLTTMRVPPHFNFPKSLLQLYGESVYSVDNDMLGKCSTGKSPLERFIAVIAWSISTLRPYIFGLGPYNPILGETHHVSRGTLNFILEQVSHHPSVTALHATDEKQQLELLWCQHAVPKFYGTSAEIAVHGKRQLKLVNHGETYVMNTPKFFVKFLPVPGVERTGNGKIQCQETGLEAELSYGGKSRFGLRGSSKSVKGKIFYSSSLKPIFEIDGHWDKTVTLKNLTNGEVKIIYDAKKVISRLKTPIVKDPKRVWPSESAAVWGMVNEGILNKDWGKAIEAKKAVEEKQRELLKERKSRGETWVPKHFIVSYNKEDGWDCSPKENIVPPAPIVVPF